MANGSLKHDTGVLQTNRVQGREEMACEGTGLTSPASVAPELCLGGVRAHGGGSDGSGFGSSALAGWEDSETSPRFDCYWLFYLTQIISLT